MYSPFEKIEIEQTISRRFADCVRRYAEDVALRYDKQAVTYRALNARSNQIANAILRRRGDREETVALLLGQGISAVAGIIGLLKAGKAYVCSLDREKLREYRGNFTTPGKDSPLRNRSGEVN